MEILTRPKIVASMKIKFLCSFIFLIVCSVYATDSILSYENLPPYRFQDRVMRYERSLKAMNDTTLSEESRQFSKAAVFYYSENWDSAFDAYSQLIKRDSLLERSVLIRMARIRLKQGNIIEMRNVLAQGASLEKDEEWQKQSWRLRSEAVLMDSTLSESQKADSLEAFLNKYPKSEEAITIRFRYAVFLDHLGKKAKAKRAYLRVLADHSRFSDSAYTAIRNIRETSEEESFEEKIAYTKITCAKDFAAECVDLIDSIFNPKNPPLSKEDKTSLLQSQAVALRSLKRDEESIATFKLLLDSIEMKSLWIQSSLRLMRKNPAKYKNEIKSLDSILQESNRYSPENANNLWVRGFEHEQNNRYDKAINSYQKLAHPRFKNNAKRQWAKFRIAFIYFKQGKYPEAEKAFLEAKKEPFTWSSNASRMFLGDTYKQLGNDSLAKEAYLDCIKDFPLAYYAHRSRSKLIEYKLMDSSEVPFAKGFEASEEQTLQWIRNLQKTGKKDSTYNPERYNRIKHLFLFGFTEEAFDLYNEARYKNAKHLDFLYEYGTLFYEMGEIADGYRLARQFQNVVDRQKLHNAPIRVLKFLYPIPYVDAVKFRSGDAIDPFFVYSVMRQESIFNFEISSPVGARGLLQIMPATGKQLAKLEDISDFDPNMLFNPFLNIRLGIRYLIDLKKEYDNDYMYVLGNYNAGPKPTKRWQAAGGNLPWDIRAEEISYWETRDYVKRVMGNYWIYQEIWNQLP
jgi:soluble lytic murein transglycosylase